ncbi:MAG: Selenocysteine-specific translation elongation factor [uncultured Thermomicrobiales bacterium]|uniref:Selenocysteine-specific elongation factor n=1 Tax=uncultured Thermomicrobiales bacterium TaxID=1645740 RepID=A0A6J4V2H6_9BACT|nr:MAG: Selenocysteine-specific translation elongation factor [uncultured Thermomicrobiales bacterium]
MPERFLPDPSRRAFTVGTAGHVDHGKSTLVKALTGIDPDRLAEEKARAMTIDLGFAWLALPSGRDVSVVDVPGHERFIKNMLAGVGGIDAALLIVAADEGPMPQTREHLAILDLLRVERGIVVLTKRDTVDVDWLDLVSEETREAVTGTVLADAPMVAVSAQTGEGLRELRGALDAILDEAATAERPTARGPRLPVDRVFSVSGFGTVATGTLLGGELTVGQELRVYPDGRPVRVRGLQSHGAKVERARPGARTAVNLSGVAVEDLRRGDVLAPPGALVASRRLDARLRLLAGSPVTLEQNAAVDLFVGATELPARLTLLDRTELKPGDEGWVQIRFREPIAVLRGDRFIVRRPSPSETIGGGEIVDPGPVRHRRFRPEVVGALETLAAGAPDELLLQAVEAEPRERRVVHAGALATLSDAELGAIIEQLVAEGDLRVLGPAGRRDGEVRPNDYLLASPGWERLGSRMVAAVEGFHAAQPLRRGIPKEALRSRLGLAPARLFDDALATASDEGMVVDDGQSVRLPSFAIELGPERRATADRYLAAIAGAPYSPPAPDLFGLDDETLGALVDRGEVVRVAEGVVYDPKAYAALERETVALIDRDGTVTLAGFRDHFGTSRKYAQATLEHLDARRVTRRVGDQRVRGPAAEQITPRPRTPVSGDGDSGAGVPSPGQAAR